MKRRGNTAGSTVWHKIVDGQIIRKRLSPGVIWPDESWIRGSGPMKESVKQAIAERMKIRPLPKGFSAPIGSKWFHRQIPGSLEYEEKRFDPGNEALDQSWLPGHKPKSDEVRETMRKANTGRVMSPEWRAKMSAASKGKAKSPEHIEAMRAALNIYHQNKKAGLV